MTGPRAFDPNGNAIEVTRRDKSPGEMALSLLLNLSVENNSQILVQILTARVLSAFLKLETL